MKVVSKITEIGLTEGKEYDVIFEYDSVYEVILDNGNVACRSKIYFTKPV